MALRWIRDNIGSFNGDSDSITLFGPGAGAASSGLLAVAPQTRNIVSRIIAQVSVLMCCSKGVSYSVAIKRYSMNFATD